MILLTTLVLFQHRTQDFEYLLDGIIGILEQQMATLNNLFPGAKKTLPYITETSTSFFVFMDIRNGQVLFYFFQSRIVLEADRN